VRPLDRPLYRTASWVLVVVLLASSFAAILATAAAASTTYALTGFVDQPGGLSAPPVPAGVTVDLVSRATGAVYTAAVTGSGGQFTFTSAGTGGALAPGYWGLYVPPAANASLSGCGRCAVLPDQQTPTYRFYNATVLTNATRAQVITNVSVVPYNATLNGTVTQGGSPVAGATVEILAPAYAGLVLSANVTNSTGVYSLSVPYGSWVLQASHASGSNLYTNSSALTITSRTPAHVNPILKAYAVSGRIYSSLTHAYVTVGGNATLYDPSHHYLYTEATPSGGYYAFPTYAANFGSGPQTFDVVLSPVGFEPVWYALNVSSGTPTTVKSVTTSPSPASTLGTFNSVLDFTGINPASGSGVLRVNTTARLGNDTVLSGLPNASVGQLWAQLGLDFNNSLSIPAAAVTSLVEPWVTSQGPFFPAVQAGTAVNATPFVGPTGAQPAPTFSTTCSSGYCGLASGATLSFVWQDNYTLNGTIPTKSNSYTISLRFAHPASSTEVYNYTFELPTGYALYAGTSAPAQTVLSGQGSEGTWTDFTLESKFSATAAATATFTIVKQQNFTAVVSVSATNFTFSSKNILNSTHANYSVVLGSGESATYSAARSTYPNGANGTRFLWNFGDLSPVVNTTNLTVNHTITAPSGGVFHGTLTILSSGGRSNSTTFNVSVVTTSPKANISSNATSRDNRSTVGRTSFVFVNWSTTLGFNATFSKVTAPNNLSVALYTLTARGFTMSQNYSASAGANPDSTWTVSFGENSTNTSLAAGHGNYVNFSKLQVNGTSVGVRGFGWVYNLTLEVWSLVGTTSTAHLTILVNDTEKPIPSFTLLNAADAVITPAGSITEGPNHYVLVRLDGNSSKDLGNGSIVNYTWFIYNPGNGTGFLNKTYYNATVRTAGQYPTVKLLPKPTPYKIRLTTTDANGNKASETQSLEVAENTTLRPLMEANNLTGPSTVNVGTSYTYWVNVTVGGGTKAVAQDVNVWFYLLSPSGTGSRTFVGGSPRSVVFYGYSNTSSNATVNATSEGTGSVSNLKYGLTVRAEIQWTPGKTGSFILYAYASASNQFVNNSTVSTTSVPITVKANPVTQDLEYGGIAAGAVIVLAVLILFLRRRSRGPKAGAPKPSAGRSGLERSAKRADEDEDDL
jgi:hypothetical protein